MEKFTLTAADHGIAAAAYDDAMRAGLGDEDTADMIVWALGSDHEDEQPLYKFAYGLIASKK
jgi:hypothetical protein